MRISATSREYLLIPVEAWEQGSKIDPTGFAAPEFAFRSDDVHPDPSDWRTGEWEQANRDFFARCLVGPGGGVITLQAGTTYNVWVRILNTPEAPEKAAGTLEVV